MSWRDVQLTYTEMALAGHVGVARMVSAMKNSRTTPYGSPPSGSEWEAEIEGAAAELLVAKVLGLHWNALVDRIKKQPDVGQTIEVRWARRANGGMLLHEADRDERPCVLVVNRYPDQLIVGWGWIGQLKVKDHWRTDIPRPAFIAPQSALNSFDSFPKDSR